VLLEKPLPEEPADRPVPVMLAQEEDLARLLPATPVQELPSPPREIEPPASPAPLATIPATAPEPARLAETDNRPEALAEAGPVPEPLAPPAVQPLAAQPPAAQSVDSPEPPVLAEARPGPEDAVPPRIDPVPPVRADPSPAPPEVAPPQLLPEAQPVPKAGGPMPPPVALAELAATLETVTTPPPEALPALTSAPRPDRPSPVPAAPAAEIGPPPNALGEALPDPVPPAAAPAPAPMLPEPMVPESMPPESMAVARIGEGAPDLHPFDVVAPGSTSAAAVAPPEPVTARSEAPPPEAPAVDEAPEVGEVLAAARTPPSAAPSTLLDETVPAPEPLAETVPDKTMAALPGAALPIPERKPSESMRARIAATIGRVDCGRVAGHLLGSSGALQLSGHVPSDAERTRLIRTLAAIPGVTSVNDDAVVTLPRPHCAVLDLFERAHIPISREQTASVEGLGKPGQAGVQRFHAGEPIAFNLKAPDYPAYVYIDYYDGSGRVYHLLPNPVTPDNRFAAGQRFQLGGRGGLGRLITAAPPFGLDLLVAFAASEPIFGQLRQETEEADYYLSTLSAALSLARGNDPDFRAEFFYIFVLTEP
jgi:hypothetical protein